MWIFNRTRVDLPTTDSVMLERNRNVRITVDPMREKVPWGILFYRVSVFRGELVKYS